MDEGGSEEAHLLLDGSWGVMMQATSSAKTIFAGKRFGNHPSELKGNNDLLTLTRPDIVREIGHAYLAAARTFLRPTPHLDRDLTGRLWPRPSCR
ncbi:MAG: homocysteine S-methyltransferase family protein [Rhizomicrobium sp.]